jgi:hypothetical protein
VRSTDWQTRRSERPAESGLSSPDQSDESGFAGRFPSSFPDPLKADSAAPPPAAFNQYGKLFHVEHSPIRAEIVEE